MILVTLLLSACAMEDRPTRDRHGPHVALSPADARSGVHDLVCSSADAVNPTFRWTHDGILAGQTDRISATDTREGGAWACEITDGDRVGRAEVTLRPAGGNLLVILADDLGRERLSSEGVGPPPFAVTPNLDALAARSVRFTNAWAFPVCSPTRAALMTGRLPRQYGVGIIIDTGDGWALPDDEAFLPEILGAAALPMTSALVGKWHLNARDVGSAEGQPGVAGFSSWRTTNGNLTSSFESLDGIGGYRNWEANVDGILSPVDAYATAVVVDDAVDALATLEPPWFLYVALHAMHEPWHTPAAAWRYTEPSKAPDLLEQSGLMLESLDVAVGQVLDAMTAEQVAETTIVFLGDNGTMFTVATEPFDATHSKGTVYQGGVNVPFWVSGPLIGRAGATSEALVHASDVFDTGLALAGIAAEQADGLVDRPAAVRFSESVLPLVADPDRPSLHPFAFTEKFEPNGPPPYASHHVAVRDSRFKLLYRSGESGEATELYDLLADPFEASNLLGRPHDGDAEDAKERLQAALAGFDAEFTFDY